LATICGADGALAAVQGAVAVAARYNARVAHVETVATLYNDSQEIGGGSGVLIGDRYVLTNNHVVPREQNYRAVVVSVRLKSRLLAPHSVKAVLRDPERDLALLELEDAVADAGGPRCPMPIINSADQAPMGTTIIVLGFPLNQDLSMSGGLISNQDNAKGRWQTDTLINPGNSGGPAFDENGAFLGVVVGGITKWNVGGEVRDVSGLNFIIPTATIVASPIFAAISRLPAAERCWTDIVPVSAAGAAVPSFATPDHIGRTFFVSETKDDHPVTFAPHSRSYQKSFQAEPGYKIAGCSWSGSSENNQSDVVCNVAPGGGSATFAFRLTSGPAVDRWRGWMAGTLTLAQERVR